MIDKEETYKFYIKVRPTVSEDKPFYRLKNDFTRFTLFDPIKKAETDSSINLDFNRIFTNEENSFVYEEICLNAVDDFYSGINTTFIGYGVSHSGKKEILFGTDEMAGDMRYRGCYPRLIESALKSKYLTGDYSLAVTKSLAYNNKFLDLNKLAENNMKYLTHNDLNEFLFFKQGAKELGDQLTRKPLTKLSIELKEDSTIFSTILRIEQDSGEPFFSRSHIVYTLYLMEKNKELSNCTFVILAGSEKTGNSFQGPKLSSTKDHIYIQNSFSSLISLLSSYQSSTWDNTLEDCSLTYSLKKLINKKTKFRFVGSIFPTTGYYDNVKDTLMYLFKCKKTVLEEIKSNDQKNEKDSEIEEIVYNYENKLKLSEKAFAKLTKEANELKEKLKTKDLERIKILTGIRNALGFEGEIEKLASKEESAEGRQARRMKEAYETVSALKKKVAELEHVVDEKRLENKKLEMHIKTLESDTTMVGMLEKMKEKNLHEEKRLKLEMENNVKMEELRRENEYLKGMVTSLKKNLEKQTNTVKNLPEILTNNIGKLKEKGQLKDELSKEIKSDFDKMMTIFKENHSKEMRNTKRNFEEINSLKETELIKLKGEKDVLINESEEKRKQYKTELVKLFQMTVKLTGAFKGLGDEIEQQHEIFKETFRTINKGVDSRLSKEKFPMLFEAIGKSEKLTQTLYNFRNEKNTIKLSKTEKIEKQIEEVNLSISVDDIDEMEKINMKERVNYKYVELREKEKEDLVVIIENLQEGFKEIKENFKKVKELLRKKGVKLKMQDDFEIEEKKSGYEEDVEHMRLRLQDLQKRTIADKVTIESQNRMINLIQSEKATTSRPKTGQTRPMTGRTVYSKRDSLLAKHL